MTLRYLTAGESHGPALTAIVDGVPAGLGISKEYINEQLARRQGGYGRGGRMLIEKDKVDFLSGVRGGTTLGSPITLQIHNKDWPNWEKTMAAGVEADLNDRTVTKPRPGHADLTGSMKYGHTDLRNILERASARETAIRVAAGTIGRQIIESLGLEIAGHVTNIGGIQANLGELKIEELRKFTQNSELAVADPDAEAKMIERIKVAKQAGDTLGGIFEIWVEGCPPGLGSYIQWDKKIDGKLAQSLMSIQAIKAVEVGAGLEVASLPGSAVHDEIFYDDYRGFYRNTNRAGGIEGGMTNGERIIIRAAMKPIPTLYKPLRSVDLETKEPFEASIERSDVCAVTAALVVGEAVVAFTLAQALLEKFGQDNMVEVKRNLDAYLETVRTV